jgi:hypothetical protein
MWSRGEANEKDTAAVIISLREENRRGERRGERRREKRERER